MILVSVGNANQPFPRLLLAVEHYAMTGLFDSEEVLIQAGHTPFDSRRCRVVDFMPMDAFVEAVRRASVLICHGGAGTLHHAFECGKVPVVMPRRVAYGEHVDDQMELVSELAAVGRVVPAYQPTELPLAVERARNLTPGPARPAGSPALVELVAAALDDLMEQRGRHS